jgi:hypothetical protein
MLQTLNAGSVDVSSCCILHECESVLLLRSECTVTWIVCKQAASMLYVTVTTHFREV